MTRSFSNRLFGGVCGGLAASFPFNAWIWRLMFILLTLATSGVGAIVYLLFWWLLPLESPIRRGGGGISSLLAVLLSIALIALWFLRSNLNLEEPFWAITFLIVALVFFLKQLFSRSWENIALGLVAVFVPLGFLLDSFGLLQAGLADMVFRAYPAVLIFLGLSLALRYRVRFGAWIALGVSIILVVALASFKYNERVDNVAETNQIEIAIPNEEANDLPEISENVTTMLIGLITLDTDVTVTVSTTGERQITGEFIGSNNSEISIAYNEDGQVAQLEIRERYASDFPRLEDVGRGRITVQIPADIALGLRFTGQNGDVSLDMAALDLEQLIFTHDSGNVLVRLPSYQALSPSVQESNGDWTVNNGNLRVIVPDDLGVRFSLSRANNPEPSPSNFDELRFQVLLETSDYVLASRQFDSAEYRMRFRVDVSGGSFVVANEE